MEKTRVPKGEKYWFINTNAAITAMWVDWDIEGNYPAIDAARLKAGNKFLTKEEADSMARKLNAVLKGADVIEMPSDEEIENAMKTSVTESILCVAPYESFTPKATDLLECAWIKGAEFVKSKIVK